MTGTIQDVLIGLGFVFDGSGANSAKKQIASIETQVNSLSMTIFKATAAFAGMLGGEGLFLKAAGNYEKTTIAFETMTQSVEKGHKLLKDVENLALVTPFSLSDVENNSTMLMGMGIELERIIPTMKALGDVAAGINRPLGMLALNYGQVKNAGFLAGTELRDFNRIGVPITEYLAKQLNVGKDQIKQMASDKKITFEMVEKALMDMSSEGGRFADLGLKTAKTLPVMLSNAGIFLTLLSRKIGNELLPEAKEMVTTFTNWVEINKDIIKLRIVEFFKAFNTVVKTMWDRFTRLFNAVNPLVTALGGMDNVLQKILYTITAIIALKFFALIGTGVLQVVTLTSAMYKLATAGTVVNATIGLIPMLIGAAIVGLGLLMQEFNAIGDKSTEGYFERKAKEVSMLITTGQSEKIGLLDYITGGFGQYLQQSRANEENLRTGNTSRNTYIPPIISGGLEKFVDKINSIPSSIFPNSQMVQKPQNLYNPFRSGSNMVTINVDAKGSASTPLDIGNALSTALSDSRFGKAMGYDYSLTINEVSTGIRN